MSTQASPDRLLSTCTMRLLDFDKGSKELEPRDCLRLFLCLSGSSEYTAEAEDVNLCGSLRPGVILVVPGNSQINYEMSAPTKGMVVGIDQRQISAAASLYGIPESCMAGIKPMLMQDNLTHSIMDNMAQAMIETPLIAQATHAASLPLMLLSIMRASQSDAKPETDGPIERVIGFVGGNLESDLRLDVLAEVAGLSKWHFSRHFLAQMGMSPRAYVAERRIERAKTLLTTTNLKLSEIAYECGFSSQSHMTTVFGEQNNTTPGRFRAMSRN